MTLEKHVSNPENLLPLSIIKKISAKAPFDNAEFHYSEDGNWCVYLVNEQQRVLVANKQGDVSRTWRSVDRALVFLKKNFVISVINIHCQQVSSKRQMKF